MSEETLHKPKPDLISHCKVSFWAKNIVLIIYFINLAFSSVFISSEFTWDKKHTYLREGDFCTNSQNELEFLWERCS